MSHPVTYPPFKPGSTTYCFLGNELLNGQVDWQQTVIDIIVHSGLSIQHIAGQLCICVDQLKRLVCYGDFCCLDFKRGARLMTLHERYVEKSDYATIHC